MDNPVKVAEYKWKFNQAKPMAHRYYYLKHKHQEKVQITLEDFIAWYGNEPKQCFYCDIPYELLQLNNNYTHRKSHNLFTIDRLNPNGDYAKGNIVLACPLCNLVKSNFFTVDDMRAIAQRYIKPKWQKMAGIEPETIKEAGWKSPEEWQTEYLILERKSHSTGKREVIEEIQKRSHVINEDDIDYGDFLSAGDRIIYAHVWQALQHLEKGEER